MYKVANMIVIALITIGLTFSTHTIHLECSAPPKVIIEEKVVVKEIVVEKEPEIEVVAEPIAIIEEEPELPYSKEELELIALVTMAEAEGEPEEGQRLVIDTILNRVDHKRFPDTVEEVIYQPSQFSSMWDGRVDRCYVKEDIYQLVLEEIENRTNYDVTFFTAGDYGKYGKPMFPIGNHYFSSYT